jgi:peptidoglycan hydrolase-like protein with peptidoglycan-binding domain
LNNEAIQEAKGEIVLIGNPVSGDMSSGVRRLQISLKRIGYADYNDTAIFGAKTQNSILDFQKDE